MSDYDEKQEEQRRSQEAWNDLEFERLRQRNRGTVRAALGSAFESCSSGCSGMVLAVAAVVALALRIAT